jgi:hypothetical protein
LTGTTTSPASSSRSTSSPWQLSSTSLTSARSGSRYRVPGPARAAESSHPCLSSNSAVDQT